MAKALTNEVPLKVLTAAEYCYNSMLRRNSPFVKGRFIVGEHSYTPEELEVAYPITHVNVVMRIHDKRGNLSTKNRP